MNNDDLKRIEENKPFSLKPCKCISFVLYFRVYDGIEFEISHHEFNNMLQFILGSTTFKYLHHSNYTDFYNDDSICLRLKRYGKIK